MGVGQKLRAWREQRGLTQAECAKRTGIWQTAWSRIESSKQKPSVDQALAIQVFTGGLFAVDVWATRRRRLARIVVPPSSPKLKAG